MPDNDDKTVKELIASSSDEATQADLERWFALPSFQQLAEQQQQPAPPPAEDPEWAAFRKRRAEVLANVDPNLLEAHRRRVERQHELRLFQAEIEPHIRTDITMLDQSAIDRGHLIAEPRTYELPPDLEDAMTERTPQALLRDLHRPEMIFEKMFVWLDPTEENRVDLRAIINEALAFRPPSMKKVESKMREVSVLLAELHQERRKPWTALTSKMRNRRVKE